MAAKKRASAKKTSGKAKPKAAKKVVKKKRIGRPPRAGEAGRGLVVRLTDSERTQIDRAAKTAGKSVAAYVRDAALSASETD
ncbi:MAG: DUF1778 domain-containing protein [Polyangiaceae bacterium]|nr:DUF1778 domain-containing protein [Polyangiaceae bacterium]